MAIQHSDSVTDTATILTRLGESRREAALAVAGGSGSAAIATMNFIVFVDDPAHREWVLERAQVVVGKHPARLIVLDSTDALSGVDVSTVSQTRGDSIVINERVSIGVRPLDHGTIISLIAELSVPEIPLILWWSGARLLQSRTFSGLAQQAATVLVDSSGMARGAETIHELGEFLTRFANVRLQDLAFMRLAPWQDMIAQFFDDPALREDLFSINGIEIESGSDAEALYLAGWLGSRLSWEPAGRDSFRDRAGNTIPFTKTEKGDQRRVISVVLRAGDSTYRAALSNHDESVVCLSVEGAKAKPKWHVPLQNITNTALIERAIIENMRDQIFETSLLTVRDFFTVNSERAALSTFDDAPSLAEALAAHIVFIGADALERRGRFDIALAGGSTPQATYALLRDRQHRTAIDWSLVRFFFGDERCVPPDDAESNYRAAKETLLDPLQIRPHAVFRMLGEAEPSKAAQLYVETLKQELGSEPVFDLVLLGMGPDGHTASLFPGTDPETDDAELVRAPWVEKFVAHRITITPHVINSARNVAIAVAGSSKAEALAAVMDGPYNPVDYPIQIVSPRSGKLAWLVDRAVAAKLK